MHLFGRLVRITTQVASYAKRNPFLAVVILLVLGASVRVGYRAYSIDRALSYFLSAGSLETSGRYQEAIALYERTMRTDPEFPGINYSLGRVLLKNGDYQEAIRAIERSRASKDTLFRIQQCLVLAKCYSALGQVPEACAELRRYDPNVASKYAGEASQLYRQLNCGK